MKAITQEKFSDTETLDDLFRKGLVPDPTRQTPPPRVWRRIVRRIEQVRPTQVASLPLLET